MAHARCNRLHIYRYKILAINPRGAISSVEDRAIGLDFSLWRAGTEHLVEMDVAAALV